MRAKTWVVVVLVLGIVGFVQAQGVRVLELRGGYLNPKGTNAGLIFGGSYGVSIDERVDLSLGFSVFHKGYQKETAVVEKGVPVLSDIPLLGLLFKSYWTTKRKKELRLYITPRIIQPFDRFFVPEEK